ncbi:MAG: molybdopterin converting factor subunit 1 [Aestuariivirga sp.]|uniref:molybdopterin converting factor subunit 1 n=1 Tax=Aestuariivirga sp. TaxID=2650926 RepID=UPI0025BBB42D|nr:molybdopterin converting factor subunit 1 [Aestuariivirga sp.]MCA3559874.1 molybdopterin converting factor subunit 1 [Aestuariivirga sp.]
MKILYFARIRQIAGKSAEDVEVPASVATVADLIDHLSAVDEAVAAALAERRTLRAAVDQTHVALDAPVRGAREVAFFPPVTGG